MTEQANAVPAGQADNAAQADAAASGGSPDAGAGAWWSGLQDEGNRKTAETKGWKSPDDAIKSYAELEKRHTDISGKALTYPAPDAGPDAWNAFYAKAGRPDSPDGYEFKLPEKMPENLPYDGEFAKTFKAWAHEQGMSTRQAQGLHDKFVAHQVAHATEAHEQTQKYIADRKGELHKLWGDAGSDKYQQNAADAQRWLANNGGDALVSELKQAGMMTADGVILSPLLANAFAVGAAAYHSDTLIGGGNAPNGPNPYADGTANRTEQMRLYKAEPDKARALISAAGKRPSDFGLS